VPDQRCGAVAQGAHQPRGVAGQRPAVVSARRLVAAAVSAQIDRDHPGTAQAGQLMSPRPPERPEAVQQDDQRTIRQRRRLIVDLGGPLGLDDVEADPVGVHIEMTPRSADAHNRRIGSAHYQPDGSFCAAG